jgi:hypothetical protein
MARKHEISFGNLIWKSRKENYAGKSSVQFKWQE